MSSLDQQEKIPALGRPFHLGMLYDIRTDKRIVGKTLWSQEELESNLNIVSCPHTNTKVVCGNTTSEQSLAVKVDGRLKLNVLCNHFDLQGSAAYLKDDKHSKRQAQVVLQFERRTQHRELTMEHLKNTKISHPEILNEAIATHVVVGIEYGGKIIMKFAQEVEKEETLQKLQIELKTLVEGVASRSANGTEGTENIKCQVYSDFPVEEYPSTYEEAVKFYKKLPSLTGNDEIGVPVVVHLWPLDNLRRTLKGKKRVEVRKEMSAELIDKAIVNIEQLQSILTECEDLVKEDNIPSLKRQLTLFMKMVQEYTAFFKKKISELTRDNEDFDAFLNEQEASVFSCSKWLDEKKVKMKLLQGIFKSLKGIINTKGSPFVNSEELNTLLMCDQITHHLVCLAFKLSSDEDAQFSSMQAFLKKREMQKFEETASPLDITLFRAALKRFKILNDDNQRNLVVKFVATEEPLSSLGSSEKPGVCVRYYYEGELKVENLMPLEKSQNLRVVDFSSDSVKLAWDYSLAQLNGKEDKVQYKTDHGQWQTVECNERTATIQGLKPATKYTFRVRAHDQIFLREIDETVVVETKPSPFPSIFTIEFGGTVGVVGMVVFFAIKVIRLIV